MLKDKLLEEGVHSDAIEVVADEQEATAGALEMAESGDLVLVLGDNVKRTWKQIIYFNSGAHVEETGAKLPATIELPETDDFEFDSDLEIISDERGVRIAREDAD
jgi:cyanophycin synthetase